jgi:CHAT domain-containing protein
MRNALPRFVAVSLASGLLGIATWSSGIAAQQSQSVSLRDSFPVGSNGLCEAQIMAPEPGAGLFDRRYAIVCRDAAAPVGTLWVVRGRHAADASSRFGGAGANCSTREGAAAPEGLPDARALTCTSEGSIIRTNVLVGEVGGRTYAASGFAAYEDALRLGVGSLATDRLVAGDVEIPLTQSTDAEAFARAQAEAISADQALIEAYRRSNQGNFAEAAEFFAASAQSMSGTNAIEARLNEGLQQSNLGNHAEALRLFNSVREQTGGSPVLASLLRNYEALDALNRRNAAEALRILDTPLASAFDDPAELRELTIGDAMASRLAAENAQVLGGYSSSLTPLERAQLLGGQADYLRAAALRMDGRADDAAAALARANLALAEVRGGRVMSIAWLRAQVLGELAELSEARGDSADAEALHQQGIALLGQFYPEAPILHSARAQLAAMYARTGRSADALSLYRDIVEKAEGRPAPALRGLLDPYFALVLAEAPGAQAAADIFAASQLLQRPGLAQTQAVLARELSGGSDEASQLFRKTINIGRAIEQLRAAIATIPTGADAPPEATALLADRTARLEQLQVQQAELQQQLAAYPKFRAVSGGAMTLAELQQILRPDEAYVKLVSLDRSVFVIYATQADAVAYRADGDGSAFETLVDRIRESIALTDGGEILTLPFDVERSRELYQRLFGPIGDRLPGHAHIVFEPDGALLRLPINLLVTDDASVERYKQRLASGGDEYDFRETAWLGRNSRISTAVAPTAFRDVRASRSSAGSKSYLGLGQNTPVDGVTGTGTGTRSVFASGDKCQWSPAIWGNPIAADELRSAAGRLSGGSANTTEVLTGNAFTDSAIKALPDLAEYRILHFATHGLVTAPEPECPPRPALLTSFGDGDSDGLLTFAEIYGLRLDADLVILSACDTAGSATVGATREAGVTSGGDFALDGLVRAFVGAGGRTVLASHWPVPDDYQATQRLITGLFEGSGVQTAEALRRSQLGLMDSAETSHPFYWSAFAVVGDGEVAVTR